MKNNFKILLLTFNLFIINNIQGQVSKTDSISELIIDPLEISPFSIERKSIYVNLPDKLKGEGLSVIKLHIKNNGKVIKMDILKLKILLNDGEKIEFSNFDSSHKYPPQIQPYYYHLKRYVGSIKIVSNAATNPPNKSFISFLVRFKK